MRIQDIDLRVRDRTADRYDARMALCVASPGGDIDGRLGRAVQVMQFRVREARQAALLQRMRQGLAAAQHAAQALAAPGLHLVQEQLQHRWHEVQRGDPRLLDRRGQIGRVFVAFRPSHHQTGACQQRPEQFPDRHIEAERGLLQYPVAGIQAIGLLRPPQPVDDATVLVHHALGAAGGARGVDHVGQVVWLQCLDLRIVLGFLLRSIQVQHWHRQHAQLLPHQPLRQHCHRGAVLQHVGQTILRI
ncbi:hypothetical protein GO290_05228 [Ralstonia solanacearum]|nr:hypothetical protein [Ralstonia solanacearum]NKF77720.1 hypothetical protein [Ralstonia solanacearum]NKF82788.1 hypothetical protein [Ralstonia solanacearum]NKF98104.1 hypothetical protein [Ralstonia solanacearum]